MANTRKAVGAVTLVDIKDGIHPIAAVLSNQSHIFAANQEGVVATAEKDEFLCDVMIYVGDTRAEYDNAGSPANITYKHTGTAIGAGWVLGTEVISVDGKDQLRFDVTTIPTGTTPGNVTTTADLTFDVTNSVGNVTQVVLTLSLAKAIEGVAGQIVNLSPSKHAFKFDELGNTSDGDIVIDVTTEGNVGVLSAQYAVNGGSWSTLTGGSGANQAKSLDIDGTGDNDHITISTTNFDGADVFSIRVSGAAGGRDTVSIVRAQKGDTGQASLFVAISSSTGGFSFKNNSGANKTLTAKVYDMQDGSEITSGVNYQWYNDGVLMNGMTAQTLTVSAADIPDGEAEEFSCEVTVS